MTCLIIAAVCGASAFAVMIVSTAINQRLEYRPHDSRDVL